MYVFCIMNRALNLTRYIYYASYRILYTPVRKLQVNYLVLVEDFENFICKYYQTPMQLASFCSNENSMTNQIEVRGLHLCLVMRKIKSNKLFILTYVTVLARLPAQILVNQFNLREVN